MGPEDLPHPRTWQRHHTEAADQFNRVRGAVRQRAEGIHVPQELLLAPGCQRRLAWDLGRAHASDDQIAITTETVAERLAALEARPWQIDQVGPALSKALAEAVA